MTVKPRSNQTGVKEIPLVGEGNNRACCTCPWVFHVIMLSFLLDFIWTGAERYYSACLEVHDYNKGVGEEREIRWKETRKDM